MTTEEFSNEFDILYNNITSNQAPGLDEYEKSVFLTKAQTELIRDYFNSRVDGAGGGFDGSQKRQYDFSQLIITQDLTVVDDWNTKAKIDKNSVVIKFPPDYFLSINEVAKDANRRYTVVPISYSEYHRLLAKPYPYPPKKIIWRLIVGSKEETDTTTGEKVTVAVAEIIGKFEKISLVYTLRYVKKPSPIILTNIGDDDLSIDGVNIKTECSLPTELHKEILERAVTLAKIAYQGGTTATIANQQNRNNQQQ